MLEMRDKPRVCGDKTGGKPKFGGKAGHNDKGNLQKWDMQKWKKLSVAPPEQCCHQKSDHPCDRVDGMSNDEQLSVREQLCHNVSLAQERRLMEDG